ncbi:MAG: PilZ domain-containing protein [Proteobacteria bacterium]|nr:PilZ domain-containing protein [Pseudomonadota bacterium]MBU1716440.1 PilZ domain-containing protein [Pseudomonadota bacterium]
MGKLVNKRHNTRVPFQATVDLVFADRAYDNLETGNLSMKGVFVPNISGHQVGECCDMVLHLSGTSSDVLVKMKGKVVRVDDGGIGLGFYEIDLDSFYHLKNIVYYNSGNPDVLEDEFLDFVKESVTEDD